MFRKEPWTLNEYKVRASIASKPLSPSEKRDKAVSTARVISLFEEEPNSVFTNRSIAKVLGLSEGTVSCITNRLEATSAIKITGVIQVSTAYSLQYQHKQGPLRGTPKYRGIDGKKKDSVQLVHELFELDKNAVYTKKQLVEILKGQASAGHISESLRILLVMRAIKIIDDFENKTPKFQHILGNKEGLTIYYNKDSNFISLGEFCISNFFSKKEKEILKRGISKSCRLYYSSKSLIPTYPKADLEKYANHLKRKGLIKGGC